MKIPPLFFLVGMTAACALPPVDPGPAPSAGEGPLELLQPHWDQVCMDDRTPIPFLRVDEVIEDQGLAAAVNALLPPPVGDEAPAQVDVAITYARTGEVRTVHAAGHNVEPHMAEAVAARVAPRVRAQERLLAPTFLRLRVTRGETEAALRLLRGWRCLPHISHDPGEPPRFLEGARVSSAGMYGRTILSTSLHVQVLLHLARTGEVVAIEATLGDETLVPRVRRAIAETVINPGLLNGEPVESTVHLLFRFPD